MPISASPTDEQRATFNFYLATFFSARMKAKHVASFSDNDVRSVGAAILLTSYAGQDEIEEAKRNALHAGIHVSGPVHADVRPRARGPPSAVHGEPLRRRGADGEGELLMFPDERVVTSKSHAHIRSKINRESQLGNIDAEFVRVLNELDRKRGTGRYVGDSFT